MARPPLPTPDERIALDGFLDHERAQLVTLLDGLTDAEARSRPTVSGLSLLGLLKHCTLWEQRWLGTVVAGGSVEGEWPLSDADWTVDDFAVGPDDTVEVWLERFDREVAAARVVAAGRGLDDPCELDRFTDRNLRWVLLHLVEEYARHLGHGDILRETILADRAVSGQVPSGHSPSGQVPRV